MLRATVASRKAQLCFAGFYAQCRYYTSASSIRIFHVLQQFVFSIYEVKSKFVFCYKGATCQYIVGATIH